MNTRKKTDIGSRDLKGQDHPIGGIEGEEASAGHFPSAAPPGAAAVSAIQVWFATVNSNTTFGASYR